MDEIFLKFGTNFGSAILRDEVPSFLEQQIDYVFHQSGSTFRTSGLTAEKFEIVKLADIDYSNFTLSKYVANDIDWGDSPGKPPTTCCIL